MRIRLTLRRDPAEAKDLAITVDGRATVADIAAELWTADPARRQQPAPPNLSLRIDEAFVAGGMRGIVLDRTDNLLESGLRPGSVVSLTQVSDRFGTRTTPARPQTAAPPRRRCVSSPGPTSGGNFPCPPALATSDGTGTWTSGSPTPDVEAARPHHRGGEHRNR